MSSKRETGINIGVEESEQQEESRLQKLWRRFGFRGQAPKPGTPAEKRLEEKCSEYIHYILDPNLMGQMGERSRRALHNEIAVMVLGNSRDQMDSRTAEGIADFASLVATGMSLGKALEEFDKQKGMH